MIGNEVIEKYDKMYTENIRLESFKTWPFEEDSACSASKMAEAGFFHCPTQTEPDLVQCYVCFKELDGWESTDEPWAEHYSHAKYCVFAQLKKPQKDLTVEEIFQIEAERKKNKCKRLNKLRIQLLKTLSREADDFFTDIIAKLESNKKKK